MTASVSVSCLYVGMFKLKPTAQLSRLYLDSALYEHVHNKACNATKTTY